MLVEDGIMTIDERNQKIEEKFFDLKPEGETWQQEEMFRSSTMKPTKFVMTPELHQQIANLKKHREQNGATQGNATQGNATQGENHQVTQCNN